MSDDQWDEDFLFDDEGPPLISGKNPQKANAPGNTPLPPVTPALVKKPSLTQVTLRSNARDEDDLDEFFRNADEQNSVFDDDFDFNTGDDIKIESIYASVDHFDYDDLPQIAVEGFDFEDEGDEVVTRGIPRRQSSGKPGGGAPINKTDKSPPRRVPSRQRSLDLNEVRFQKQNIENFVIREAEVEDDDEDSSSEDDWDAELLFDRPDYKKPEASQRALSLSGIRAKASDNLATLQYKESLLEFLESTVREKVSKRHAPEDLQENRYYFGHSNNILDDEESKNHELCNQHLKGLSDWLRSTSKALRATIHSKNCTPLNNAKSMLDDENIALNNNISTIEQLVDKCEEEPTKESCITAMEVVVKWIRSVCHHYVVNEDGTVRTPTVPSSSGSGGYEPSKCLSWEQLDQLFARCDYILNEQSKVVVGKMLGFVTLLKLEAQILRNTGGNDHLMRTHFSSMGASKANLIPNTMNILCQQISLCRIQIYMLEIKSHVNNTDNLMVQLESLELIMEELETLHVWLNIVSTFLPVEDDQYGNNGGIPPPPPSSPYAGSSSMTPSKAEDDLKQVVREKVQQAKHTKAEDSIYYHDWKQSHANELKSILIELQASCLMSKMLLLADMSPITMQRRQNVAEVSGFRPSRSLFRSTTVTNRSIKKHTSLGNGKNDNKQKKASDDNVYNVVYELSIGTQFVGLMFSLDSPSIMRAKLAFAACCYLHTLQKDALPWQCGMFSKIIQKKRNAEGFGALKRGESDIAFGIEADDIEFVNDDFSAYDFEQSIVETFTSALGPIDEIRNLQSLLYEASVELFPTAQKLDETAFALPYPTAPIFPHVSAALDLDQSIHDRLQHSHQLWGQPDDFTMSRKESSSAPSSASNKLGLDPAHLSNDKGKPLSSLLRYELHLFSFALFSQFITSVLDTSPTTSIELLEFCALILAHTNQHDEKLKYNRKALLLATKYGKTEAAIMHGRILWEHLFLHPNSVDLSEKLFVADILGEQYAIQAQYELAIKTYGVTLAYLCSPTIQKTTPRFTKHIEMKVEKLLLSLAQCYIDFGITHQGIDILQKLLIDSMDQVESLRNDERKIIALSWIAKGFFDLRDYESCKRTVQVIKDIRKERMHKVVGKLNAPERGGAAPPDEKASNVSNVSSYSLSEIFLNTSNDKTELAWEASEMTSSVRANSSLSLHYLLNSEASVLPRFAITAHNIDLGLLQARIYHKSGMFISALKCIATVIASVEVAIGGRSGNREGMLELGGLYYLRGEIQLDACRSSTTLKYPFEIGSPHLFSAVHVLTTALQCPGNRCKKYRTYGHKSSSRQQQPQSPQDYRRSNVSLVGIDLAAQTASSATRNGLLNNNQFTCRKAVNYTDAADLLWDAMKWFRRAWDIFHAAGDAINAAMSANRIAECHLLPSFVPHAYFGVPIKFALDLSNYKGGDNMKNNILSPGSVSMSNFFQEKVSPTRLTDTQQKSTSSGGRSIQHSMSVSQQYIDFNIGVQKRYASLEEVDKASSFALDINLDSSLPLELMHSYMNLAESNFLQGNPSGALPFWWETKDLFLHFFCDGCLIPLIRRSSLQFIEKVDHILDRIVRFMWKCDPAVRNNHLSLLEIHNTVKMEYNRMIRVNGMRARELIPDLQKLFRVLLKKQTHGGSPSKHREPSSNTTSQRSQFEKNASSSTVSESSEKVTAMQNKSNASFWKALKKAFSCGTASSPSKKLKSTTNPIGTLSKNDKSANGNASAPPTPSIFFGTIIRGYLEGVKQHFQQSDRRVFSWVNEHTVAEKAMDFGWSKFIDYDALVPSAFSIAPMSGGRKSVTLAHKSVLTATLVGGNNNNPDFALDKAVSNKFYCVEEDPLKSAEDVMEFYYKRYWLAKYSKLPSFLISHVLCERDLISPDDLDSESDSDDDELSSNPSSSYTGNSRQHHHANASPYVAEDTNSSNHNSFTIGDLNRPLDPNADFEWMNEIYTMYHTPSLLSACPEDQDGEVSTLLLPELRDIDLLGGAAGQADGRFAKIEAAKQLIQSHGFHRMLEARSETVLIQRIWSLFLRTENHCKLYRKQSFSLNHLSLLVRQSLSQVSMNMLRLRTYSRQFKGSLYCYDNLLSVLNNNAEFNREPRSPMASSEFLRQTDRMKVTRLQDRLPQLVYMHYIQNVLFAYQPHTGNEHVQMLGSDCCVKFSQAMSMYVEREQGGKVNRDIDPIAEDGSGTVSSSAQSSYTTESTAATYPEDVPRVPDAMDIEYSNNTNASTLIPPLIPRAMKSKVNGIAIEAEAESTEQLQREVKIGSKETMLIFDYCVKEKDQECGGGFNSRSRSLTMMKRGALFSCIEFFTDVMQTELPMPGMIAYDDTGNNSFLNTNRAKSSSFFALHGSSSSGEIIVDEKNMFGVNSPNGATIPSAARNNASNTDMSSLSGTSSTASTMSHAKQHLTRSSFTLQPSQDSGNFSDSSLEQGGGRTNLPPHHVLPVTLICSHPVNTIPWEALMMDTRIVRSLSLSSMLSQIFDTSVPSNDEDANFDWMKTSPPKISIPTNDNFVVNRAARSPSHDGLRGGILSPPPKGGTATNTAFKATAHVLHSGMSSIKGFLGPAANQKPLFVAIAWDVNGFTARQFNDVVKQSQHRRARAAIQVLDALDHNCNHILRDERNQELLRSFDRPKSLLREEKVSAAIQDKYSHEMWMLRTVNFPLNTLTSDKLPSSIFDHNSFYAMSLSQVHKQCSLKEAWHGLDHKLVDLANTTALSASSASHKKSTPTNRLGNPSSAAHSDPNPLVAEGPSFFPIMLLSYVDLIELTEALVYLHCSHRRDAILIFAPHFIQDKLSIELKIALDRWCRVDHNNHSNSSDSYDALHNVLPNTTARTLQSHARSGSFHISSVDSDSAKASIPVFHNFGKNPSLQFTASKDTFSELASESNSEPDLFPFLKTNSMDAAEQGAAPPTTTSGGRGFISRTHSGTMSLPRTGSRTPALLPPSSQGAPQERKSITNLLLDVKPASHSLRAKERTSAYHVVMDVVQRMQREHAVSITVII